MIDRVPEELWMEVCDTVQETGIKTIPKKKKCKKAKQSEEGLQIADKRREAKGKGEKERYTHLNAEFFFCVCVCNKILLKYKGDRESSDIDIRRGQKSAPY